MCIYRLQISISVNILFFSNTRYSKRPLRGPYGQMLEAEMAKPRTTDIALDEGLRPRRKISANLSYNASSNNSEPPTPCHHRTTSSPTKLEGLPGPSPELLAELLRGSSERVARAPAHRNVSQRLSRFDINCRLQCPGYISPIFRDTTEIRAREGRKVSARFVQRDLLSRHLMRNARSF